MYFPQDRCREPKPPGVCLLFSSPSALPSSAPSMSLFTSTQTEPTSNEKKPIHSNGTKSPSCSSDSKQAEGGVSRENTHLLAWKECLISTAIECGVLGLGSFTLKSGRISPYFINIGKFSSGKNFFSLCEAYAAKIVACGIEFDVLFGMAYKGIAIAAGVSMVLAQKFDKDYPFCYNRKEEKTRGEGGLLVGAIDSIHKGAKVLLVDDVITAGTSLTEAVSLLSPYECEIMGAIACLDRQEAVDIETPKELRLSATESIRKRFGFPVISAICMNDILTFLIQEIDRPGSNPEYPAIVERMMTYRNTYGA